MELERIKVGKLQDQNVKDEYVERLKDSSGDMKQYEFREIEELWKNFKARKVVSEKKKAWLDVLSVKANHRVQRKNILKDKLNDAERTYKDANIKAKECVEIRKNEIKERYDRRFLDNFRETKTFCSVNGEEGPE
ncbi:hypothetical protein EVAR_68781_1 [Eumeta japonica]|uniref:Uncharacterized protein n=1 Tax=Eumeta variegata TaxID=151549 RepID=A0A4C1ZAX4_EUMVA|nr:hypothetical protein EVAR_68781_1 [Eumeta japonica]